MNMDIIKFEKMVKDDFFVTRENLAEKIYKIPNLHSKYLKFFYKISNALIDLETVCAKLYIKKRKQILEESDEEIKPTHVDFYVNGDSEYSTLSNKIKKKKLELKIIDDALKRCGTISFFIKSIVEWERFLVGQ